MTVRNPPLDEILLDFESFGDNCEFGVFQRQAGLEPLGLLRFSYTAMANVLRALQNRFAGITELDQIDVIVAKNAELVIHLKKYDIYYHAGRRVGEIEIEKLRRDEQKKVAFLIRRLINTLTTGEKIFIRKGENTKTREQAKELLTAMRGYGPATLLWVTKADPENPPGTVRVLEPGLMRGRIDSFAPDTDAHSIDFTCWVDICENAHWLWKSKAPPGSRALPPVRADQTSNLLYGGNHEVSIMASPHQTGTEVISGSFPLRDPERPTLCRHILGPNPDFMVTLRVAGLQPDAVYTFSLWARLPLDSAVTQIGIEASGSAMIRGRRARRSQHQDWQRLECTARANAEGILFPRMMTRGIDGAVVETANWRLEPGLLVGAYENPASSPPELLELPLSAANAAREMKGS